MSVMASNDILLPHKAQQFLSSSGPRQLLVCDVVMLYILNDSRWIAQVGVKTTRATGQCASPVLLGSIKAIFL